MSAIKGIRKETEEYSVKNNADAIIFHTAICVENVTNLP